MSNTELVLEELTVSPSGRMVERCQGVVNGSQCKHSAVKGKRFCIYHGGRTFSLTESKQLQAGSATIESKRFRSIGKELLAKIDAFREDPDLYNLRDDAAYMTALIDQRAEAAAEGFGIRVLRELQQAYAVASRAYKTGDTETFNEAFNKIGDILSDGGDEAKSADEVIDLIGKRVQIVEAEQRVAHAKAYTLEVDQAFSLVMQIVGIVKQCVRNADELNAIRSGVGKLLRVYKEDIGESIVDAEVIDA